MKKLCAAVLIVFALASCRSSAGIVSGVQVTLGPSGQFTQAELQHAANTVMGAFSGFHGCRLTHLWYNEEASKGEIALSSSLGEDPPNTIVLFSHFYAGSSTGSGFRPGQT